MARFDVVATDQIGLGCSRVQWLSCVFLHGGLFPETHRPRLIQSLLASPLGGLVAELSTERTFRRTLTRVFGPDSPPSEDLLSASWTLLDEGDGRAMLPPLIRHMAERRVQRERWVTPMIAPMLSIPFIHCTLDPVSGAHAVDRYERLVHDPDTVRRDHVG